MYSKRNYNLWSQDTTMQYNKVETISFEWWTRELKLLFGHN